MDVSIDIYYRFICSLFDHDNNNFISAGVFDKLVQIFITGFMVRLLIVRLLLE
jgi:hypothetical protein